MNALKNKGQALILVMILSAIFFISSIVLYFSITSSIIETKKEYQYVKGYYASLAGLRLASIWLQNPTVYPINGSSNVTIHLRTDMPSVAASLNITDPHDVVITINQQGSTNLYDVAATYNY